MTSLYILAGEYKAIENKLMDSELDPQIIADTLEGVAGELELKATNVAMVIRNFESLSEQIKQAEIAMSERRKAVEAKANALNKYLLENMQRTGINKIECPHFAIMLKKNPPSVIVDDESLIDGKFFTHKTVTSLNKVAVKQALQNGEQNENTSKT